MEPKDYREAGYASLGQQVAAEGTGWIEVRRPDPRPPATTPEGILLEPGDRSNEDATQRALDGQPFTRVRLVDYGITGDTPLTPEWFATPVEQRQNPESR